MSLVDEGRALQSELVTLRRHLHGIPETGLYLPETQRAVLDALDGLPLEITLGTALSSVVAVLRGGLPGPTVLLRGDMDALPVSEQTGLEWASTNGNMHACGHDLHVAGLVGAARLLCARREEIRGSVVFMFQPGEESYGGAEIMLSEGLLAASGETPIAAYGIHVMTQSHGVFATKPGPLMAGVSHLFIDVVGRGGHGSMPFRAVDPIPIAAEIVLALQTYVGRYVDVFDPVVITIGEITAGSAPNVIPETAHLRGSVRTLSVEAFDRLAIDLPRLVAGIASAYGATASTELNSLYPVTVNDEVETGWVVDQLGSLYGDDRVEVLTRPFMGSEDFSYVLEEVPGTFVFLGVVAAEDDPETVPANHSAFVRFDDAWIGEQAAALAHLAVARLELAAAGARPTPDPA